MLHRPHLRLQKELEGTQDDFFFVTLKINQVKVNIILN